MLVMLVMLSIVCVSTGITCYILGLSKGRQISQNESLQQRYNTYRDAVKAELLDFSKVQLESLEKQVTAQLQEIKISDEATKTQLVKDIHGYIDHSRKELQNNNDSNLKKILDPLQEKIHEFKQKSEGMHAEQSKTISSLNAVIKHVIERADNLTTETNKLTNALRNNKKQQGNIGEYLLYRVLELSGLKEGVHFTIQPTYKTATGDIQRPDVIISLPKGREVIIDSKMSLNSYVDFVNADTTERDTHLDNMKQAFRQHVANLSSKDYAKLEGINTCEAVFLFIPHEAIFLTLSAHCPEVFEEAMKKKIYVVTTYTLMPVMHVIQHLWDVDSQNKSIQKIVTLASNIYDKFVGITGDFEIIGKNLTAAQKSHEALINKVSRGRGNITRQLENLKQYGVRSNKQIPGTWLEVDDSIEIGDNTLITTVAKVTNEEQPKEGS